MVVNKIYEFRGKQKMENVPKSLTEKRKLEEKYSDSLASPKRKALMIRDRTDRLTRSADNNDISNRISTISNMGNTCYLNSVLYTMRFVPNFSHNLHHLVSDLDRIRQSKTKALSLGRGVSSLVGVSSRSSSSRDLLSLDRNHTDNNHSNRKNEEIVSEKLHEVFATLRNQEIRQSSQNSPYQPVAFLQAIRSANSNFAGFLQQDAHELLVFLLGSVRDAYDILAKEVDKNPQSMLSEVSQTASLGTKLKKYGNKKLEKTKAVSEESINGKCTPAFLESIKCNFITENFKGTTLLRTKCCDCECASENREEFFDIPVALGREEDRRQYPESEIFYNRCLHYEILCGTNKYLCEECCRHNEATMELLFEKLPNILVFQLKRFEISSPGSVKKIISYFPTPLEIDCFCHTCNQIKYANGSPYQSGEPTPHKYRLCSVIMHLGTAMASGHYISYVRLSDNTRTYATCKRQWPTHDTTSVGSNKTSTSDKLNLFKYLKKPLGEQNSASGGGANGNHADGVTCKSPDCCVVDLKKTHTWLECDDDTIRSLTTRELEDILGKKDTTATPYLLFYEKI